MSTDDVLVTLDDVAYDLEGSRKAGPGMDTFFDGGAGDPSITGLPGLRTRGQGAAPEDAAGEGSPGPPGAGRHLVAKCPDHVRARYRTLLRIERGMLPDDEYGFVIAPACQILEEEFRRSLTEPARPITDDLLAALDDAKYRRQREVLETWGRGSVPVTLGVISLVLFALRKGCERDQRAAVAFLRRRFDGRFVGLLAGGKLDACLEAIRNRFRNPAAHGTRSFDPAGYAAFARLAVANDRFAGWDRDGPDPPDPGPAAGVLHHHLVNLLP